MWNSTPSVTGAGSKLPAAAARTGEGRLDFERSGIRTVARELYATSPLKLFQPRNGEGAAWIYTSSLGGGLVAGDEIRLSLRARAGARCVLLSQSATKVFRGERESLQQLEARVEEGALLLSLADPVIAFRGSRYLQLQRYELAADASLVHLDSFVCGREAAGERWAFERLRNRIEIRRAGRPVLHESLRLDPEAGALGARLGRFNALATLVCLGPLVAEAGGRILRAETSVAIGGSGARAQAQAARGPLALSASALGEDGVLIRIAGESAEEVSLRARALLDFIPSLIGDNPWARKW